MPKFHLSFYEPTGLLGELRRIGDHPLTATEIAPAIREAAGEIDPPAGVQLILLRDGRGTVRWARAGAPVTPADLSLSLIHI